MPKGFEGCQRAGVLEEIKRVAAPLDFFTFHVDGNVIPTLLGPPGNHFYSLRRDLMQRIFATRAKEVQNLKIFYNALVKNVDLKKGSFEVEFSKENSELKDSYDFIFATDGTFSRVLDACKRQLDFDFSIKYNPYAYREVYVPLNDDGTPKLNPNAMHQWTSSTQSILIYCWPNQAGDFTAGIVLKLKGENSFEYFSQHPEKFEEFFYRSCPDAKGIMPLDLSIFEDNYKTRLINMKCSPWNMGKFLLLGDAAHTQHPHLG